MRKIQGYGYHPDFIDRRDRMFSAKPGIVIPKSVDLRPKFPAPWDQGRLGSCTAFALTGAVAFLVPGFEGSQLWLYYQERKVEGTIKSDSGAMIRDGIKVLAKLGLPPEADWPYDISKFEHAPPSTATADAKKDIITAYQRLASVSDMKACLAQGDPFVVGINVYESFESAAVAQSGEVPMPLKGEQMVGGHAICVVGYETDGRWIVRNSWGTSWGLGGYFHLPVGYLAKYGTDAWSITGDKA